MRKSWPCNFLLTKHEKGFLGYNLLVNIGQCFNDLAFKEDKTCVRLILTFKGLGMLCMVLLIPFFHIRIFTFFYISYSNKQALTHLSYHQKTPLFFQYVKLCFMDKFPATFHKRNIWSFHIFQGSSLFSFTKLLSSLLSFSSFFKILIIFQNQRHASQKKSLFYCFQLWSRLVLIFLQYKIFIQTSLSLFQFFHYT